MFTEEEDADKNGRIAVLIRIVQHHCVSKMVCFDVSYGYVGRYVTVPQQQFSTIEVKIK